MEKMYERIKFMKNTILTFHSPSEEWIEGMPLGNSNLGVMVWGKPQEQTFSLNHEDLWRSNIKKEIKTAHIIDEIRKLVLEGKRKEAHERFVNEISQVTDETNSFQPFYDLIIKSDDETWQKYERSLDIAHGVSYIAYSANNHECKFTSLVSKNYGLVIIKLETSKPSCYEFSLTRDADEDCKYSVEFNEGKGIFKGEFVEGVTFSSVISIEDFSGKLNCVGNKAYLKDTTSFVVKISMSTSYNYENHLLNCHTILQKSTNVSYDYLFEDHKKTFYEAFKRVEFSLCDKSTLSTSEMYNNIFDKNDFSNSMYEQLFNMARYLLLSTSSENSRPMNLQGIWNRNTKPIWECGHTMDMNTQMDYWLSMPGNMFETQMALFNWIEKLIPTMQKQAKDIFGIDGVYIPQYTDVFMVPHKSNFAGSFQVLWCGAAAWIAQHFIEHYKYTKDEDFLLNRAYPFMKKCVDFYKGFVIKNEEGKYLVSPSSSPENIQLIVTG